MSLRILHVILTGILGLIATGYFVYEYASLETVEHAL